MGIWRWWLAGGWTLPTAGPWGARAEGAMASLSSASTYRTELLSAYGQGHSDPRFEGDRRHGPFGARGQEAFGYPGTGRGGWGGPRVQRPCYPGGALLCWGWPPKVIQLTCAWGQCGTLPSA